MTHTLYLRTDTREQLEDALISAGMLPAEPDEAPALAVTAFELDWLPHPLTRITGYDENDEPVVETLEGHHCSVRVRGDVPASLADCCVDPSQPVRVFAGQ